MSRGNTTGKFRSIFESEIAEQLDKSGVKYEYENKENKIEYEVPIQVRRYLPDFAIRKRDGTTMFIEAKGTWDSKDRNKHLLIRRQYPEHDIRFVFYRVNQRIRKGSKTTYRDICEGRGRSPFKGVTWKYSEGSIPEEWLKE